MRTLHILSSLDRRGAEVAAVTLVDHLSREEFEPMIWTIRPAEPSGALVPARTPVLSWAPGRPRPRQPFLELLRLLGEVRPDLVHCHGGRALKYAAASMALRPARAYVYTKIGSIHPWLDDPIRRRIYRLVFERLDAMIAVGDALRREVEATFRPVRPRLVTIPTGYDVTPFAAVTPSQAAAARAELGVSPDGVSLMAVGSLTWEKDVEVLLRLVRALKPNAPPVILALAGTGPLEPVLRARAASWGIGDQVRFLGVRTDIPVLLSAADVVLLPSRTEGLPGTLIEAGLAGVPAVAFGVGAVAEVVQDGVSGFVIPPGDEAAFGAAVRRLLEEPVRRTAMGREAMRLCRQKFDLRRYVAAHEALFRDLLLTPPRPARVPHGRRAAPAAPDMGESA